MTGSPNLTAKDRMTLVDQALDDYEKNIGLPVLTNPCPQEELQTYFTFNRNELEKLTSEDCGQIAYRLAQFAFYIQRLLNRESARISWAQANLNDIVARKCNDYDKFTKHEVKISLIQQDDKYAHMLGKILTYADQRKQRLTFLSNSIKNLSDIMLANKRNKSYDNSK